MELYYDGSEDIVQTVRQCEADMEQVAMNEHAVAAASEQLSGWTRYTSPENAGRAYWHNANTDETVRGRDR